jgi:hypothetical protein
MQNEDEFWHDTLSAFETRPDLATPMAQNLAALRDMLAEGDEGIRDATEILNDGIREIYPHTDFSQACMKLYDRYISKEGLLPKADPILIIENLEEAKQQHPKKAGSRKARKSANKK